MEQIERRQISSEKRLEKILVYLKEGHSSSQSNAESSCYVFSKSGTAALCGASSSRHFGSGSGKQGVVVVSDACSSHSLDMTDDKNIKKEITRGCGSAREQNTNVS